MNEIKECNEQIRQKLRELRIAQPRLWSNAELGKKLGYTAAVLSRYLSEEGCKYNGDIATLEKKAEDMLGAMERRRTSGVETSDSDIAEQMRDAFNLIRKTNDFGGIIAESGKGKTRGIELILRENALAALVEVTEWACDKHSLMHSLWAALPHDGWDRQGPKFEWFVRKVRGSDLPLLVDDAHKLSLPALSLLATFQDKTKLPIVMVGTSDLVRKMEMSTPGISADQRFSRCGLKWVLTDNPRKPDKQLLLHMVRAIAKDVNGELDDLLGLCQEVAGHHGHFRAVEKQLKLAQELRRASRDDLDWCGAFRKAHGHLHRLYELSEVE